MKEDRLYEMWLITTRIMADEGAIDAIGFLAQWAPTAEERERWESIYMGELSQLGLA